MKTQTQYKPGDKVMFRVWTGTYTTATGIIDNHEYIEAEIVSIGKRVAYVRTQYSNRRRRVYIDQLRQQIS
jgi:hypothetical protein